MTNSVRGRTPLRRIARAVAATVASLALAVTATACGTAGGEVDAGDKVLRIVAASGPNGMDPTLNGNGIPTSWFFTPAYSSLLVRQQDGQIVGGLAESYSYIGDDNTLFELKLRPGIKFSDGEDLNSEALKTWIEYFRDGNGNFAPKFKGITEIELVDDLTVRLHLDAPDSLWPGNLSQDRYGLPISPKAIETPDMLGSETVGAGPYKLDSAATVTGQTYTYKAVPDYWDPEAQKWDEIVITVITDANSALGSMQSGQVDLVIGQARSAATAEEAGINVKAVPYLWDAIVLMDRGGETVPALGDVRVRQALNYAVDRDAVMAAVFGDYGQPNDTMILDGFRAYDPELEGHYAYNPEKAKELLAEAGYADGFTMPMLVWNRNGIDETTFSQAVAGQLAEVGVEVELLNISDASTLIDDLLAKKYPTWAFFGQVSEPSLNVNEQLLPDSGALNPYATNDPKLIELWEKTMSTPPDQLAAAEQELQAYVVDQAFYLQVGISSNVYFYTDKLAELEVSGAEPILHLLTVTPAG